MKKNVGKKQYSEIEFSIIEYDEFDVVRTSVGTGTYDDQEKEWYGLDEQWGGLL